jgi:hypothetical protein
MIDADGHIREIESDVFEYLPENYQNRRAPCFIFRSCRTMVGTARRAAGEWADHS